MSELKTMVESLSSGGIDLPLGLGIQLAQDSRMLETYAAMPEAEKRSMVNYIRASQTGAETAARVEETINELRAH